MSESPKVGFDRRTEGKLIQGISSDLKNDLIVGA